MAGLRESIATLQRYSPNETLNISDVQKFLFMERPLSIGNLIGRIASLPDSVPFHATIVTGTALGGEVTLTLNRNGTYRFNGSMRASGAFSFSFRVGVVVRSGTTQVVLSTQHNGEVFGTDTPGKRQDDWDETITDPKISKLLRELWPDISGGKMSVTQSSELSGVLNSAINIVKDVAEFFVVAQSFGGTLAVCLIIGGGLGDVGVDFPGLGGMIGVGIIAGSLFICGPLSIGPAFLLGVAVGAIVDALVKIRRVTGPEQDFARAVFGDKLDFERIRITNLVGMGGRPFTTPTIDDHILVNLGVTDAMFDDPTTGTWKSYSKPGQLFIHELTHAWQIIHVSIGDVFVPGLVCEGIEEQVIQGKKAYSYGPPGPPWGSFSREGQAHMVDDWFAGTARPGGTDAPPIALGQMDPDSPYFAYINTHIQTGTD